MDGDKIVAILFSDVVGYAHVTDPEKTAPIVHDEMTRNLVRSLTQQHDGNWIREVGDAVVCTFGSAVAATQCALEIQRGVADASEFRPRIGIHIGDVEQHAADVDTDAFRAVVNVAARVQALSDRGGICITGRVHEELRSNQAALDFDDLGEASLADVEAPTQVYRINLPMIPVTLSEFTAARRQVEPTRSRVPMIAISTAVLLTATLGWLLVRSASQDTGPLADGAEIAQSNEADRDIETPDHLSEPEIRAAAFSTVREKLLGLEGNSDFDARVWTTPDPVKNDTVYHVEIEAGCTCSALLFAIDGSADEISLLYPNPFHRDGSIRRGQLLKVPASNEFSLRAVGGEGIDVLKLVIVDGPLELGVSAGDAWRAAPEQTARVAELATWLESIEVLDWDSATAPLQIIP
jgi:class 3 adenylate cyclase